LSAERSPYSSVIPGTTKLRVTGFITSMVTAAGMTRSRAMWAGEMRASSRARTWTAAPVDELIDRGGTNPRNVAPSPTTMRAMLTTMGVSMGMPASR
jgi:hypothetical protein